ncbi:hypothetical protein [Mycetocola reblochoni]|uniref:Uncharacterized protein n=2 Tax=Mycetocola reblochoni TaxID=331618 RepID=A0A1R4JNJ4_9MICO|nr:hypothetical protein [Mycetocola reblochoni]RLP68614.1 hypothetical protein D9V30_10105 [Mycetocola reblochoni]SJN33557.1 hypothetical protein FM119_08480 [Mycetocola reblochoni REB411]
MRPPTSSLLDPDWPITPILATVGEYAAGIGLIAVVVLVLSAVAAIVLGPRRPRWLGRVLRVSAVIAAVGIGLWILILLASTVGGSA